MRITRPKPPNRTTSRHEDGATRQVADPLFVLEDVTKVYRTGEIDVHALRGIDLKLPRGEFVVMLGPSGSGKSTLLNLIGGLDTPTSGSVRFLGQELAGADDRALTRYRREHVGFIFQFYNLVPSLTARENVELVTEIASDPLAPADALERVGLADRMNHFPAELSGGEQQRVAVARAIAKRPAILLCDEPTGALDIATGITVLEALDRANRETGATCIVITHNTVIADMADRVIKLADGSIVAMETRDIRRAPDTLDW